MLLGNATAFLKFKYKLDADTIATPISHYGWLTNRDSLSQDSSDDDFEPDSSSSNSDSSSGSSSSSSSSGSESEEEGIDNENQTTTPACWVQHRAAL